MIKNFLNEGHQHPISGSKVTVVLLKGWLLPTGGVASGRVCGLQHALQACLLLTVTVVLLDGTYEVLLLTWTYSGQCESVNLRLVW